MTIYRGANKGIQKMFGGAFYTESLELAQEYADFSDSPEVYEFNASLNLFDADDLLCATDIDAGIDCIIDELEDFQSIFEKYDGIYVQNGAQIILFGTLDINDSFVKQSLNDLLKDAKLETRRYDR